MASPFLSLFTLSVLLLRCFAGTLCTMVKIDEETVKKLATASNDLALGIHRSLASDSLTNVIFSPLSLSTALGMLYYAAKGNTAEELRQVLGYEAVDFPDGLVHRAFQKFLTQSLRSKDAAAYVLNSANVVLLDESLEAVPSYKEGVRDFYNAFVVDADFGNRSVAATVLALNSLVKELTNGKIDQLVEDLDPSAVLVLLNAVYFKGRWKSQFDSRLTRTATFFNDGVQSNAKEVPMMQLTESLPYAAVSDVQAVELPYKGDDISMLVILPNDHDGLESFEKGLSPEKLSTLRRHLKETDVHLALPKFKLQYSREMSGDFLSLGARGIFGPGADLSGMTSRSDVYVSQVIHKAVVEVNEEGSEAAAVSSILSNRMGSIFEDVPLFVVDHPFMIAIMDRRSGMVLFLGRVTNL